MKRKVGQPHKGWKKATKYKFIRTFVPTRKNNMTEITGYTVEDVLPLLDEEGNPVVVQVGEGEVATPDEVII